MTAESSYTADEVRRAREIVAAPERLAAWQRWSADEGLQLTLREWRVTEAGYNGGYVDGYIAGGIESIRQNVPAVVLDALRRFDEAPTGSAPRSEYEEAAPTPLPTGRRLELNIELQGFAREVLADCLALLEPLTPGTEPSSEWYRRRNVVVGMLKAFRQRGLIPDSTVRF